MPAIIKKGKNEVLIPRLMIVRGAPGIGKSTVSKSINKINSATKKTCISVDAMQHMDLRNPSRDKEKLGIKNAAILASSFLGEGFDVVLDYVFDDISDIDNTFEIINKYLCSESGYFAQLFFLDAPIEKAVKRNQSRSNKRGEYMNTALLKKLYIKVSDTKGMVKNEIIVDTSDLSAKQTARMIVSNRCGLLCGTESVELDLPAADLARSLEKEEEEG